MEPLTLIISLQLILIFLVKSGILKFGVVKSSASFTKVLVVSVDINNAGTYTAFASTVSNTTISTNWSLITLNLGTVIDSKSQVKIRFNTVGSGSGVPNIRAGH